MKLRTTWPRGTSIARGIEDAVLKLGEIQIDALNQALSNMDIREFLARTGVMSQKNSSELISQRLRRWIPACD
jgi:hypothetical protein